MNTRRQDAAHQWFIEDLQHWSYRFPRTKQAFPAPSASRPNPQVAGDLLLASIHSPAAAYALDRQTGQLRWKFKLNGPGFNGITHHENRVYAQSIHSLFCLNLADGKQVWKFCPYGPVADTIRSSPIFHEDKLFFGDRAGRFHCLDVNTAKRIWAKFPSSHFYNEVNCNAVLVQNLVLVGCNGSCVVAYEMETGEIAWQQPVDGPCTLDLLAQGSDVLVFTASTVYRMDAGSGTLLDSWTWDGFEIRARTTCADEVAILIQPKAQENQASPDPADKPGSEIVWLSRNPGPRRQPASDGAFGLGQLEQENLLIEVCTGGIGWIEPEEGHPVQEIVKRKGPFEITLPSFRDGMIYVLEMDGTLTGLKNPLCRMDPGSEAP